MHRRAALRFRSLSLAVFVASGFFAGCGGQSVESAREVGEGEPLACGGALDGRGSVLVSNVESGRLFTSGERLILVESRGRILSIDRCSGDQVELARDLGAVTASVLLEPHVWFRAEGLLSRVAVAGGPVETILDDAPSSSLVTDGSRVYFFGGGGISPADVWSVGGDPVEASAVGSLTAPAGHLLRLLAAGPAGLYFSYDCDCAPWLSRFVPGEAEPSTLEGAGGVGVWGNYVVSAGPDRLYVAANSRSGGSSLRRVPFEGGEAEELLGAGSWRTTLRASDRHACWLGGEVEGPTSVNCLPLLDPQPQARELDSFERALTATLTLAEDAVYWLRPRADNEPAHDLLAAAL